jgi:nicotinate phosphoribosyltransferase
MAREAYLISAGDARSFTDRYFTNSRKASEHQGYTPLVLYQVFQRHDAILCGVKYVLQLFSAFGDEVQLYGLEDGNSIASSESVLHIIGPCDKLFELETIYLGLLARMTRVATAVRRAVEVANGKPILFFPARFDVPEVQEYDGYAAKIGGAIGASTEEQAASFPNKALGTMPHALIAAYKGDTAAAALALSDACPNEPIWALVDFTNDSPAEAVRTFKAFKERGKKLTGVRVDTSQDLVDQSLQRKGLDLHGVVPELVRELRRQLDDVGGQEVKITVSGGFTPEKIQAFEEARLPVDVYAVGEYFLKGSNAFTSDIVAYYEGEQRILCAKVGREFKDNPRFKRLK